MRKIYTRKTNCTCTICTKDIYRRPSQIEKGLVYCSQKCYGLSIRKTHPCLICGADILSSANKKTCSSDCENKARELQLFSRKKKDKANPSRNNLIREKLFTERGKSCECCGYNNNDRILEIHHKIRKCDGGSNDLSNLQILCPNCHAEIHLGSC